MKQPRRPEPLAAPWRAPRLLAVGSVMARLSTRWAAVDAPASVAGLLPLLQRG